MRQMVAFTLKGAGHTVFGAEDGQAALDAVVTDVNMPRMDGVTLVK